ncbi:hypothetical protein SDRG_09592 [Saprolegnia diclina VS20]|uniref:Uncharacterized protein n=1 Tax=Saprolegnia diclina (strain VS20) TaxID=1156394 RepID=T0RLB7_SAPDV|nr:hypothetical protein SDRG_09592 [Saprolegnia diclina VS20]EQC33073.1 hypothetical protein SDRG_09592 [Saprolegnia diclina VS20]|eukprot:XP_008613759.1 hypothetical protein SDRG_09592 [Saprolegnia diclina VS20]
MTAVDDGYQRALQRVQLRSAFHRTGWCPMPNLVVAGRPVLLTPTSTGGMAPGVVEARNVQVDATWEANLEHAVAPLVAHASGGFSISLAHVVATAPHAPLLTQKLSGRPGSFGTLVVLLASTEPGTQRWSVHSLGKTLQWTVRPLQWCAFFGHVKPTAHCLGRCVCLVYHLMAPLPRPLPIDNTGAIQEFKVLAQGHVGDDPCLMYVCAGAAFSAKDDELVEVLLDTHQYDVARAHGFDTPDGFTLTRVTCYGRLILPRILLDCLEGRVVRRWFGSETSQPSPALLIVWPRKARLRLLSIHSVLDALTTTCGQRQLQACATGKFARQVDTPSLLDRILRSFPITPMLHSSLARILVANHCKTTLCLFLAKHFVPSHDAGGLLTAMLRVYDVYGWTALGASILAMVQRCHAQLEHVVSMLYVLSRLSVRHLFGHAEYLKAAYTACLGHLKMRVETPFLEDPASFLATFLRLERQVYPPHVSPDDRHTWFAYRLPRVASMLIESFQVCPNALVGILLSKPALSPVHVLVPVLASLDFRPAKLQLAVHSMYGRMVDTLHRVGSYAAASFLHVLDAVGLLGMESPQLWTDLGVATVPVLATLLGTWGPLREADVTADMLLTVANYCVVEIPFLNCMLEETTAVWSNARDLFPRYPKATYDDTDDLTQHLLKDAVALVIASGAVHTFVTSVHSFLATRPIAFRYLSGVIQLARALSMHGALGVGRAIAEAALTTVHAEVAAWTCFLECACIPCTGLRFFLSDAREGVYDMDDMDAPHVRTSLSLLPGCEILPHHTLRVAKENHTDYPALASMMIHELRASVSNLSDI